jgi:hypothetical protein
MHRENGTKDEKIILHNYQNREQSRLIEVSGTSFATIAISTLAGSGRVREQRTKQSKIPYQISPIYPSAVQAALDEP